MHTIEFTTHPPHHQLISSIASSLSRIIATTDCQRFCCCGDEYGETRGMEWGGEGKRDWEERVRENGGSVLMQARPRR